MKPDPMFDPAPGAAVTRRILMDLLDELPDFRVMDVCVGVHWTAVVAEVAGVLRCGLASTLANGTGHTGETGLPHAGRLLELDGRTLARWVLAETTLEHSLGMAALNAALPLPQGGWIDGNGSEFLASLGKDKKMAVIGHFPFLAGLRPAVAQLWVLEKEPHPGDLPAEAAPEILPQADVVVITAMTLVNHTLGELLQLCAPGADVVLLGPSTPLSLRLGNYGINWISGSIVENVPAVLRGVAQAATFRQIQKLGVRLVTLAVKPAQAAARKT
jgi:uncharacterized protein